MARETKAQFEARVAADNRAAASLATGATYYGLFGETVLGEKNQQASDNPDSKGWDMYTVHHSGFNHCWSSAVVRAAFGV